MSLTRYRASMTESQMLQAFRDLITARGGAMAHVRDARGQQTEGLPDVILCLPVAPGAEDTILAFFELKTANDRIRPLQRQWLDLLGRVTRIESAIVRPVANDEAVSLDAALDLLEGPKDDK